MKQFLPFLTDDQGRSLSVDNEVVVTSSIPDPLNNSPEGWEKNTLQWARNNEFWGIVKSYTTALKFYKEGAKILRNAFYKLGMETVLYFIWLKQNVTFGAGMKYEGWYKGEPDFSTFKDEWDGVEVSIIEGGFFKDLQANKAVVYEVPFDDDAKYVFMDGMYLYQRLNYEDITGIDVSKSIYSERFLGPYPMVSQDGNSVGFLLGNENLEAAPATFAGILESTNIVLQNLTKVPIDVAISGRISFTCTDMVSSPAYAIKFRYLRSLMDPADVPHQDDYKVIETEAMVVGTKYYQDFAITITLQPNETLLREGVFFGGVGSDATIQFNADSKSTISFKTRSPGNLVPAYRAIDYGKKLVTKMSSLASFSSTLLEPDYNLMITCGDALRNLPGAVLKGTFSDYFKSIDAVKCAALDIVNNIPVLSSRYDKFNKNSTIANLGECSNWALEPDNSFIYDTVKCGFPPKGANSNIDVNGRYSFNNSFLWKIEVTRRNKNEYKCLSAYFADPYDIELVRVNFLNKDTTTANTDNSVFFLDAEPKTDLSFTGTITYNSLANTIELSGGLTNFKDFITGGIKIQINGIDYTILNNIVETSSGVLVAGKTYTINSLATDDDFSNVGFASVGVEFIATGTTPNNWTNGTIVINKTDSVSGVISLSDTDAIIKVVEYISSSSSITGTVTWTNLYQLRRKAYKTINGIINDGTVFNIELSPRRCLQNHLPWLRSSFDHLDMKYLLFQTTDKNANLQTIDSNGNVIAENANIQVGTMGEKVYLPYSVKLDIKSPQNLLELMTANNDGVFGYIREGIAFDGFPIQISTNDATLEEQTYTLLCSANCDLTKLINNR